MRTPLSWLRDFAPFSGDPDDLATTLDDLGLVVESIERVGQGLSDIVVGRVTEIALIAGADKIRLVTVDTGAGPVSVVCGAWNFEVGDLVPLAPVGAVLPNGMAITERRMKGVVSHGMLCSGQELGLSDDQAGLLVLSEVQGARPSLPITEALGIEPDVVFDITVEGNRPDAWSIAGVARDLAARLHLPFTLPTPAVPEPAGPPVGELASLVVQDADLSPRVTVKVLTGVRVGPSPRWLARRLTLAGMRPINNVVDASNYVMLELGQPTHPYDLDRLGGSGLLVRKAQPGESIETLDGVVRTLGQPGRGAADTGEDCVICDAAGTVVGIAGIMGGTSSEISETTTRVLLETAYFNPMAIARTSKRLGLRTEASARFERGCDPWGIDRAAERFCELLAGVTTIAPGTLDERGLVPEPLHLSVPLARVNAQLGTTLDAMAVADLLEPIGFGCESQGPVLEVTVPTNRPDVRPAPFGVDDVIEEVARMFGYSRLAIRTPSWPQPGRLTDYQRQRRLVRDVLCGVGASEAWTSTFVNDADHQTIGLAGPAVEVTNPLASDEAFLRRSLLPGLLRAVAYNADRRLDSIRLFEIGTVFSHPDAAGARVLERSGAGGTERARLPGEREMLAAVFAAEHDDARHAVVAWQVLAEALRLAGIRLVAAPADESAPALAGLHPTRSAHLVATRGGVEGELIIGALGEVDPMITRAFGLDGARVGWLEVDLGLVLDPKLVDREPDEARPISRYPSSDVDLALVVDDTIPADQVAEVLSQAAGELLESVALFDVFRGDSIPAGQRSLAFRLRFCALDHTLTDAEVGELRTRCIEAAATLGASLR